MIRKSIPSEADLLLFWYRTNKRDLPWRKNRDPYRVWISETMLQQTTTTAVLGYYERFLKRFPTLKSLANATIEQVYEQWAGLGYYSRARNLHLAAQMLAELAEFPRTFRELIELPGFGPYTARAVSSLAFSENVGVLDGNVIRVLSRKENLATEWWRPKMRADLQTRVDQFVNAGPSHELNQALMELGSQICTPKNPHCISCPWLNSCRARSAGTIDKRPLTKPRKASEIWIWSPQIMHRGKSVLMVKNDYAPFLKDAWFLPGQAQKQTKRPRDFDFRHSITHHDIFVQVTSKDVKILPRAKKPAGRWVKINEVHRLTPASLLKKTLEHAFEVRAYETETKPRRKKRTPHRTASGKMA